VARDTVAPDTSSAAIENMPTCSCELQVSSARADPEVEAAPGPDASV